MEFNIPSLKNFFDAWFESKFYPYYKVHHPSTQKEKVLGFLRSKIYEEFHRRYFEIVTSPPSWDRYTINSLKTRQYAVCQMANWHIKYYKSDEGFETLCDKYWKQSFEKFHNPKTCTHCGVDSSSEKNKHKITCPIFQSTLTLPTIDFSSIDANIPTAKLHEAVNLAVERIDFKLYSSHNKQKITGFLFHANKQILINLIIKDFIPSFDKSNQDQDHRQILDDHLKSLQTSPPRSAVFNYCQATFGNFATINARGLNTITKQNAINSLISHYSIDVLGISETRLPPKSAKYCYPFPKDYHGWWDCDPDHPNSAAISDPNILIPVHNQPISFINQSLQNNFSLIIMGDFNSDPILHHSLFSDNTHHTWSNSIQSSRIDQIWISPSLSLTPISFKSIDITPFYNADHKLIISSFEISNLTSQPTTHSIKTNTFSWQIFNYSATTSETMDKVCKQNRPND
nr:647_t:CDS:2 [Entrophospora candida]